MWFLTLFLIHSVIWNGKKWNEQHCMSWSTMSLRTEVSLLNLFMRQPVVWWVWSGYFHMHTVSPEGFCCMYIFLSIVVCVECVSSLATTDQSQWCRVWSRRGWTIARSSMASFTGTILKPSVDGRIIALNKILILFSDCLWVLPQDFRVSRFPAKFSKEICGCKVYNEGNVHYYCLHCRVFLMFVECVYPGHTGSARQQIKGCRFHFL